MNTTIAVIAATVIVVGISIFIRARAQEPRKADPAMYVGLRNQALSISRASIGLPPSRTAPAAVEMVRVAEASLSEMTIVTSFPTPRAGHTTFYVVTDAGVYSADVDTEKVEETKPPLFALYAAGQNIITQYRLTQESR